MTESELIKLYSSSHKNETNILIHYICVPIIFLNVVSLIYYYSPLYLTAVIVALSFIFYIRSLKSYLLPMVALYIICFACCFFLAPLPYFVEANITLFVIAWIGQFVGHKIEGKNPSFFQNIFFLLVGPAWVAAKIKMNLLRR